MSYNQTPAVVHLSISDLLPPKFSARTHKPKQIKQLINSIKTFGLLRAIVISNTNEVIAGWAIVQALKQMGGIDKVPCIRAENLTEPQIRAFRIADNKLAENSEWDQKLLKDEFFYLKNLDLDFSLDVTGFELPEIDLCLGRTFFNEDVDLNQLEPKRNKPARTKLGDIVQLGRHRVLCGDSTKQQNYAFLLKGKRVVVVVTDAPYNVPIKGHVSGLGQHKHEEFSMASGEMSRKQFTQFLTDVMECMRSHTVDGAIYYMFMDWRHMNELLAAGEQIGAELKNLCVWVKDNAGMGTFYRSQHELVFVFKVGKEKHINNFELGQHGRHRTNVWQYAGANSFKGRGKDADNPLSLHPTVKPTDLLSDAIMDCSNRDDIVLDPFLGSGSTLIAAEQTERICYGLEIDPYYVDVIVERWEKLTGKTAVYECADEMEAAHV